MSIMMALEESRNHSISRLCPQLGISEKLISDLVFLGEIFENKRTRALSLTHSSIANLYHETYKESPGLGYNIRSKIEQDADDKLFYQYLMSVPFNFFRSIIALRFDALNEKFDSNLLKRLFVKKDMQKMFQSMIANCENLADIGMSLVAIMDISEEFISEIANDSFIKIVADKFNNEQKIERIGLFIMLLSNMDNEVKSKLVNQINVEGIAQKMEHNELFYLTSCLMSLYNANQEKAFCMVEEISKYNITEFIDKINSERRIFIVSNLILFIAKSNKSLAIKIVRSININDFFNKSSDKDDAFHIGLYIMTVSLLLTEVSPEIVNKIDIKAFRRVILSKIRDSNALYNANFLFGLAITNKDFTLKLMTETYEEDLVSIIKREKALRNTIICIFSLAFIDRSLGLRIINKADVCKIIQNFAYCSDSNDLINFINIIAYFDRSKGFNIAVRAIAYSNYDVARELICIFSDNKNNMNINYYLRNSKKSIEIVIKNGYQSGYHLLDQITLGWQLKIRKKDKSKSR